MDISYTPRSRRHFLLVGDGFFMLCLTLVCSMMEIRLLTFYDFTVNHLLNVNGIELDRYMTTVQRCPNTCRNNPRASLNEWLCQMCKVNLIYVPMSVSIGTERPEFKPLCIHEICWVVLNQPLSISASLQSWGSLICKTSFLTFFRSALQEGWLHHPATSPSLCVALSAVHSERKDAS